MAAGPAVRKVPAKHPPFTPVALSPDKRRHSGRLHAVSPAVPVTPKKARSSQPNPDTTPRKRRGLEAKIARGDGHDWRRHQSVFDDSGRAMGNCAYEACPRPSAKQGGLGHMMCEDCTTANGKAVYYCNMRKAQCHQAFHVNRVHQSVFDTSNPQGRCSYSDCQGRASGKQRGKGFMICEDCSRDRGSLVYYCNRRRAQCHILHHAST